MVNEKKSRKSQFIQWMGPLLDALRELGGSGRPKEVEDIIARKLGVTDVQRQERIKTGPLKFSNQVAWCRQYLIYEELLVCPKRGIWTLTERGKVTNLSIDDSARIVQKWVKHHVEVRKQREAEKRQDAVSSGSTETANQQSNSESVVVLPRKPEYDLSMLKLDKFVSEA